MHVDGQPKESSFPDRGPSLIKLLWILTSFALLTVVLRLTFYLKKQFGWDDVFMAITMVCELSLQVRSRLISAQDMFHRMVYHIEAIRKARWMPPYLGCRKTGNGKYDPRSTPELDISGLWNNRRGNRKDFCRASVARTHERFRMEMAEVLPMGHNDTSGQWGGNLMLTSYVSAMQPSREAVGSKNGWKVSRPEDPVFVWHLHWM
jgi:hypothetical protein